MALIEELVNFTCEESNCYDKVKKTANSYLFNYPCHSTTSCFPYKVVIHKGKYRFSLWGAQGGDARYINLKTIKHPQSHISLFLYRWKR